MAVYRCPLCALVFADRPGVEAHVTGEHHSGATPGGANPGAALQAEVAAAAVAELDWARLRALRASEGSPAISLLMSTTPSDPMTSLDVAGLRQLVDRARRRLPTRPDQAERTAALERRLSAAVAAAEGARADLGLAVLVDEREMAIVHLPFEPRTRVVVGPAFALHDLVYALRRYPRYRVLVLGSSPRVFEGRGRQLDPRAGDDNPSGLVGATAGDDAAAAAHRLLADLVERGGELPLVLVGDRRRVSEFRRRSPYARATVGEAYRSRTRTPSVADIAELAELSLERWQHDRQARAAAGGTAGPAGGARFLEVNRSVEAGRPGERALRGEGVLVPVPPA